MGKLNGLLTYSITIDILKAMPKFWWSLLYGKPVLCYRVVNNTTLKSTIECPFLDLSANLLYSRSPRRSIRCCIIVDSS